MSTQINRSKKQFLSIKFQRLATTLYKERGENKMFSANFDLNRGRILGLSIVARHSDQLVEVGVVALWNWEHSEAQHRGISTRSKFDARLHLGRPVHKDDQVEEGELA